MDAVDGDPNSEEDIDRNYRIIVLMDDTHDLMDQVDLITYNH